MEIKEFVKTVIADINPDYSGNLNFDLALDARGRVSDNGMSRVSFTLVFKPQSKISVEEMERMLGDL